MNNYEAALRVNLLIARSTITMLEGMDQSDVGTRNLLAVVSAQAEALRIELEAALVWG